MAGEVQRDNILYQITLLFQIFLRHFSRSRRDGRRRLLTKKMYKDKDWHHISHDDEQDFGRTPCRFPYEAYFVVERQQVVINQHLEHENDVQSRGRMTYTETRH